MKTSRLSRILSLLIVLFYFVFLIQCELFLGENENGNVGIDLGQFYGSGRAISGMPDGIDITSFRVSVFGPGMEPMRKTVSYGTRYVNMQVPAGADRHFTLEIFFSIRPTQDFIFTHLRSFKGRTIVDLTAGKKVGVRFQMTAGATALQVPDSKTPVTSPEGCIYQSDTWEGFNSSLPEHRLGITGAFRPTDLEIAANGRIVVTNSGQILTVNAISGGDPRTNGVTSPFALAMDRDCAIDIDTGDRGLIETNLLYVASGNQLSYIIMAKDPGGAMVPQGPLPMTAPAMGNIYGMAVDPWTHKLYLVGQESPGNAQQVMVEYNPFDLTGADPGQPLRRVNNSLFKTLRDIIVKDSGIFVLNQLDEVTPPDQQPPVVLMFDKNLNYLRGFGTLSYDFTNQRILPSVNTGAFYHARRFFAQENDGLFIIDDCTDYDKIIFLDENLDPATWRTFPARLQDQEPFRFFE